MKASSFGGSQDSVSDQTYLTRSLQGSAFQLTIPLLFASGRRRWRVKPDALKPIRLSPSGSMNALINREPAIRQPELNHIRQIALTEAKAGHCEQALALFNQLVDWDPTNAADFNNRGLLHFQLGDQVAALADYDQALAIDPALDSAYNNRANYYAAQGQFPEAIWDYDVALELNPDNIRAWINQGITFRDMEFYDQALENFDIALSFGELEGHIYAERGRTLHLRGDWNWAIADYQRAIALLPTINTSTCHNPTARLRLHLEVWLDELLNPLHIENF